MSAAVDAEEFVLLVLLALVPTLAYLSWVRGSERSESEPWGTLLGAFGWGALFATLTALFVETILVVVGTSFSQSYPGPEFVFLNGDSTAGVFFLVLVLAPFVEEALKGSGVLRRRSGLRRVADGPVVGAAVGLGFGFSETFLYGLGAFLTGGLAAGIALIAIRSISSSVLHGSSTGMFGYGVARSRFGLPGAGSGSYYLLAVAMHASFNAIASLPIVLALLGVSGVATDVASIFALVVSILFAFAAIEHVRTVVHASEYPSLLAALRPPPGTRPPVVRK